MRKKFIRWVYGLWYKYQKTKEKEKIRRDKQERRMIKFMFDAAEAKPSTDKYDHLKYP